MSSKYAFNSESDLFAEDLIQTKARGYSISRMEILPHQAGLGAPVLDITGKTAGAISTRLNVEDLDTDSMKSTASRLMRTAHQISMDMGYQPQAMNQRLTG